MVTAKEERWSELMANLEGAVMVAHKMMREDEMTALQYGIFNGTIAQLESLARDLLEDSHE
jgi:hypothetical protein|tara:strand:+ start:6892 stop:7074 length:183 start_codon:yes stop_codon:yes gene_type:complete